MFQTIWTFVSDPANQTTLGWLGGGFVVVAGGLYKLFKKDKPEKPTVSATNGGVAVGGNVSNSKISTTGNISTSSK